MQEILPYIQLSPMLILATKDDTGNPYTVNVYFGYSENPLKFYIISRPIREHMKHIERNPQVAWSILNTQKYAPIDTDKQGLQFQWVAHILNQNEGLEIYRKNYEPRIHFPNFPEWHHVVEVTPTRCKIWDEALYGWQGKIITL